MPLGSNGWNISKPNSSRLSIILTPTALAQRPEITGRKNVEICDYSASGSKRAIFDQMYAVKQCFDKAFSTSGRATTDLILEVKLARKPEFGRFEFESQVGGVLWGVWRMWVSCRILPHYVYSSYLVKTIRSILTEENGQIWNTNSISFVLFPWGKICYARAKLTSAHVSLWTMIMRSIALYFNLGVNLRVCPGPWLTRLRSLSSAMYHSRKLCTLLFH